MTPAPTPDHQRVSRKLQRLLMEALEDSGQGEVFNAPIDVILGKHDIVQPDLAFVRREQLSIIGPANIQGVPDLIVEILSPSNRRTDVLTKMRVYARCGVPSYWIADPEIDRLDMYRLHGKAYRLAASGSSPKVLRPAELPRLRIPLAKVFG